MNDPELTLIINAGGKSQRMGQPKALLSLPPTNTPLLQVIYQRLQQLAPQHTLVIANDPTFRAKVTLPDDVRWLPDAYPNTGPLGGLATGLATCASWAICVACDLPLLNPALFAYFYTLTVETNPAGAEAWDAIVPLVNEYPEPLHALYHRRCLPAILAALAKGEWRATAFLPTVRVRYVHEPELRQFDPELRSFFNANTPDEWAQVVALTQQRMRTETDGFAAK
ncbi:MAG: molybdenum cofactor guanylyltransferase [Caldilinea sp. CFX5]|nr:molybdenum cofactor guanylyltransferase [Caldilinea sp. CFX5]